MMNTVTIMPTIKATPPISTPTSEMVNRGGVNGSGVTVGERDDLFVMVVVAICVVHEAHGSV